MQLVKKHIHICTTLLGVWITYYLIGVTCPILFFTGQICPTCGSTRAILSLLRGNFKMYVSYQPMAIPLVVAVILCIHLQFMKKPLKEISCSNCRRYALSEYSVLYFKIVRPFPLQMAHFYTGVCVPVWCTLRGEQPGHLHVRFFASLRSVQETTAAYCTAIRLSLPRKTSV